jgi:putative tryptophan/tyrosine transport system substrate-binding protein
VPRRGRWLWAQQPQRMWRIGVLMGWEESDSEAQGGLCAFLQGLSELGWIGGRNVKMDVRWSGDRGDRMQMFAKELVGLKPDVILAGGPPVTAALQRETRTIPIVFAVGSDPVGDGFVVSPPRPGGTLPDSSSPNRQWWASRCNCSGRLHQTSSEPQSCSIHKRTPGGGRYFLSSAFEVATQSLTVAAIAAPAHHDVEIEAAITSLGSAPGTAAQYVDRLLRDTNPAELLVQVPVKFETALNLKTAKALGLKVPTTLLAIADEVIE